MILRKGYHTSVEDFNKDGRLTPLAVLKIFENIGNRHSDKAGDSPFNFDGHTFAWVITEWKIEVTEYPHYTDTIEAETWSEGLTSPLVASRNFLLYKNGEICARGTSRWVRIDLQKGRLCKIEKELIDKYEPDTKVAFEDSKVEKIPVPEAYISEKKIAIRRSDFDFNNHVHNLCYLDYAFEALPDEVYKSQDFKKIRITYKTAVTESDEIVGKYADVDGKKIVSICTTSGDLRALVQLS